MAVTELNKKIFTSLVKKKIGDELLAERLTMLGAEVEQITEDKIIVEVLPNRPDFFSEAGLARALNTFLGETPTEYAAEKSDYSAAIDPLVKTVRPFAACAVVKNLKFDEESLVAIMQLQEKLHTTFCRKRKNAAIGVHDLDEVAFPIKYTTVTADYKFTPLDSEREMSVREILTRHPKGTAYAHLMPGPSYPIWLDAKDRVIALPPIINAARTALTHNTTSVFIDATGPDEKTVNKALAIIVCSLADAGGRLYQVRVEKKTVPDLAMTSMRLDAGYVNKLLGLKLSKTEINECLQRMGLRTKGNEVLVPAYRTDVLHQCDLAEDVAIAYGYAKIPAEIPNIFTIGNEDRETIVTRKAAEVFAGLGFLEVVNYVLSNEDVLCKKTRFEDAPVKTTNSVNANYDALRNRLLPGLLKVLSENKHHEYPQKIFEIGPVILKGPHEEIRVAAATSHAEANFSEIKSVVEAFFKNLGKQACFKPIESPVFIRGRAAELLVDEKSLGILGEIHPQVLANFGLENPVAAFEVQLAPAHYQ